MLIFDILLHFSLAPNLFCVAIHGQVARICWKDPTKGSHVDKYELLFAINGENVKDVPVVVNGRQDEVCAKVIGVGMHRMHNFWVKVYNGTDESPKSERQKINVKQEGKNKAQTFISLLIIKKLLNALHKHLK